MRTYEALFIIRPDMTDEQIQTVAKEVEKLVTDNGGTIVRSEIWGKRKLAYEVRKFTEGVYVLLRFQADAALITRLKRYFKLSETVIRELITFFDEHTLRLEAEQIKRQEMELAARAERDANSDDDDDDDDRPRRRSRNDDDEEE